MNGELVIRVDGLELHVLGEQVKYAVEGRWHHCSFDEFVELLAHHFKPTKQDTHETGYCGRHH